MIGKKIAKTYCTIKIRPGISLFRLPRVPGSGDKWISVAACVQKTPQIFPPSSNQQGFSAEVVRSAPRSALWEEMIEKSRIFVPTAD